MPLGKVLSVADAVALVRDGDTVATTGYGGNGTPDQLVLELERRFLDTGAPRGLTLVHAGGQGDGKEPAPMGLRAQLIDIRIEDRISYNADTNTVFLNYAGMHVRTEEDLGRIKDAVDRTLEPLGRRVHSIVNHDSFVADPDILDKYADLVKYVEERYYISVSRYATSGFLRLKLGAELRKRRLSSHVFETRREARRHLGAT
jgi:hypothetical protein